MQLKKMSPIPLIMITTELARSAKLNPGYHNFINHMWCRQTLNN